MPYFAAVVGLAMCVSGLFRIWVGIKVYWDELSKRQPLAAMRYLGLAFTSGWGVLMVGVQILLIVFWLDLSFGGTAPLWPGMAGVISLGIAFAWGVVVKRTTG
jgi:hypothetical protein